MKFITEKNISKIIIYVFIIIMTLMIFFISYFYVKNTYEDFNKQMKTYVGEYYNNQKSLLKKEVDIIIDVIKYNATKSNENEEELKKDTIRLLNNITYEEKRSNYIFVYDILNINGGDKFARLLVNQNRADLVGQIISTNYKDANGKKFREDFLRDIKEKGESFTQYAYTKITTNVVNQKLSYFKYYPTWNWVIAVGIYIDDIENDLLDKRNEFEKRIQKQIIQTVLLFLVFLSIGIVITILVSDRIDEFFKEYRLRVKTKSEALQELNENLEKKVLQEIEKNREKEQLLVQKSRLIALGEMISNISHQWRQPLSELSSILMNIKFKYKMGQLSAEGFDKKTKEAENILEFMSHTIDDFRDFYLPKKDKQIFYLYRTVESVMSIISSTLSNNNIRVEIDIDADVKLYTYKNELEQVILNIISNAKDVLIANNIKEPYIKITLENQEKHLVIFIEDNGGGITVVPKGKIFEPYFTTKSSKDGTGIGLYMSKIIVDKNMNGILRVRNTNVGAKFGILLKKDDEVQ